MAIKGIPYFPLDCQLDDKFALIEAEYGLTGFAVVVKLFQRIYGRCGYYCEYTNEVALLFSKEIGLGCNAVSEIVSAAIKRGIFDKRLYDEYHILTSEGIQERYFEAVSRRKKIEIKKQYLLLKCDHLPKNADISGENADIFQKNADISKQSKVKKSKVKESKVKCVCEGKTEEAEKAFGKHGHTRLKQDEYISLCDKYGKAVIDKYIERVDDYVENSGRKPYKNHVQTILKWLDTDGVKEQSKPSYDLDEIFNHSVNSLPKVKKPEGEAEQQEITGVYYACESNSFDDIYSRMAGG